MVFFELSLCSKDPIAFGKCMGHPSDASVNVIIGILLVSVHDVRAKATRFAVLTIPCQNYFQHGSKNNR